MTPVSRRYWIVLGAVAATLSAAIAYFGTSHMTTIYMEQAARRGDNTLGLAVSALRGELARYENLPELIADHEQIKELVENPGDRERVDAANRYLKSINALLESSDIYIIMPDGTTIAASNFDGPTPFVGENFSYRPYFQDAVAGGEGRFFALGTTSLKRGYYFGAPIHTNAGISGVVVFKVDVDVIEQAWHGTDYEIIVTDPEGIVFMSGREDWLFTGIGALTEDRLARTAETRRYADAELRELPVRRTVTAERYDLLTIENRAGSTEYLTVSEQMPEADWTVSVLLDTASARSQAMMTVVALLLLVGLAAMGAAVYLQSRARLAERLATQREAKEQLERRVAERTADLAAVNKRLEQEVDERRATERQLRKTQADLVQAGKLAALGQMSAALSHEFNQPLAAVRAYADNATVLIDRGRGADARMNIGRIAALVERMASISRHLRNFARKPNAKLRPVLLEEVVRDMQEIVSARLRVAEVELAIDLGDEPIWLMAGSVRLQQVLVNIVSNAADAVEGQAERFVGISGRRQGDRVVIAVRDNGPGVPEAIAARIFDPFFTTKGVGKGLGLGLSISYNIVKDFDGSLTVSNLPEGGAEFLIELDAAAEDAVDGNVNLEVAL
ncbi:ATP-binding protein [Aquamicrobium sp. LC103]|uniref:sensor histidine kinase n=1 Tax=Aquamicrobium sp. LC103 TaxID=1120658 RepID=UPI0009E5952B|nr:sensor histidine kinase [Aquamicrobium sp. LC103]